MHPKTPTKGEHVIFFGFIIWFSLLCLLELWHKTSYSLAIWLVESSWLNFYIALNLTKFFDMHHKTHNCCFCCYFFPLMLQVWYFTWVTAITSGFRANLEIREIRKLSGKIWKWTLFTEKSGNYQGILCECQGNQGNNTFLDKHFSVINFILVLFSVMYIFMFWDIFRPSLVLSIMMLSGFLYSKIWVFKCNMLDCCMMHHNCLNF